MANVKGYLLIVSALVFCPCHLPILAAILAGSAVGAAIVDHQKLFPLMAVYFIAALLFGIRWMSRQEEPSCTSCESPAGPTSAP